jgi:hypothetical protein
MSPAFPTPGGRSGAQSRAPSGCLSRRTRGGVSGVPDRTRLGVFGTSPGFATPGYFQMSLRDISGPRRSVVS